MINSGLSDDIIWMGLLYVPPVLFITFLILMIVQIRKVKKLKAGPAKAVVFGVLAAVCLTICICEGLLMLLLMAAVAHM